MFNGSTGKTPVRRVDPTTSGACVILDDACQRLDKPHVMRESNQTDRALMRRPPKFLTRAMPHTQMGLTQVQPAHHRTLDRSIVKGVFLAQHGIFTISCA